MWELANENLYLYCWCESLHVKIFNCRKYTEINISILIFGYVTIFSSLQPPKHDGTTSNLPALTSATSLGRLVAKLICALVTASLRNRNWDAAGGSETLFVTNQRSLFYHEKNLSSDLPPSMLSHQTTLTVCLFYP